MASSWILKLPRSDQPQDSILIQATRTAHSDLDLTILATEGEAVYKVKIRQRKLKDLRAKNYKGTDEDWAALLRYVFISKDADIISNDQRRGLDVAAAISGDDPDRTLTITLRNRIGDITQRLGEIALSQTDDEIQLFDWAMQAVDTHASSHAELTSLKAKSDADQAIISSLQLQLHDLVKAKAEHEDNLISKFVVLLNEKKLKIRNQQRLLSMANVDKGKLQELQMALYGRGRKAELSRATKRTAVGVGTDNGAGSSDEFETMDVESRVGAGHEEESGKDSTPVTETESEDEENEGTTNVPATSPVPELELPRKSLPAASPPPARSLPFAKRVEKKVDEKAKEKSPDPRMGSDEETASDDDEL